MIAFASTATDSPPGPRPARAAANSPSMAPFGIGAQCAPGRHIGRRRLQGLPAGPSPGPRRPLRHLLRARWGVECQPSHLLRVRAGVGERHLRAVSDSISPSRGTSQVLRSRSRSSAARALSCRPARRDGVGTARGGNGGDGPESGHRVSASSNCACSRISLRSKESRQSIGLDMPMPRRSTATIGRSLSTSAPERANQTGSTSEDGRSVPVVNTSGPASAGVFADRARTTPIAIVPVAPPTGSRSAS